MKIFLSIFFIYCMNTFAIEFGKIATSPKSDTYYKLGQDIEGLLQQYDINLVPMETLGSYENMEILDNDFLNNINTFFAIVQKDVISSYNNEQYLQTGKTVINKIPAILSLGVEQIHLFASEESEFDFESQKEYKVYCGFKESGSCVSAKYIEKAYDFNFTYMNYEENIFDKLKEGMIDIVVWVTESPSPIFKGLEGVKLLDLPTNFMMEDMYVHSVVEKESYTWNLEDVHVFGVPRVLVTNLRDKKYDVVLENLTKILIVNKKYLAKNFGKYWAKVDFSYTDFKKIAKPAKKVILQNLK